MSSLLDAFGENPPISREKWYNPDRFRRCIRQDVPDVKDEDISSAVKKSAAVSASTSDPLTRALDAVTKFKATGNKAFARGNLKQASLAY